MTDGSEKQPVPPNVNVPFGVDGDTHKALYSQMPIDDLMKLNKYLTDLISWIKKGNPIYLGTYTATITYKEKP